MEAFVQIPRCLFVVEELDRCGCKENRVDESFCGMCGQSNSKTSERWIREDPTE